jgi:ubiquinone/menaquinone biosynthesis C-methylase UbiE
MLQTRRFEGKTVLDVGCGDASELGNFARRGCECFGLDLVREGLAKTRERIKVEVVVGDACHLPFKADCFDIVYSQEFFSHVSNFSATLNEQIRVLRCKGELLIRDGNILCPFTLLDVLVLYPIRSKGRYGGLKWLINHEKNIRNIYGSSFIMKDENVKSLLWWKKQIRREERLTLKLATTSYAMHWPKLVSRILELFAGQIILVLQKDR